ncbi:hypothetical protein QOZ83_11115 [Romboutsia sedimentorum]|uniref:hypothetical protein n=1 Tax=Romboutsia sedimentorum TaxID=1368474 RepID=UPI0024DEC3CD|nr:hypothetical protein [Romboutsia sedimentorum]MDK2586412.1 hypothetical protein [Romboutsia sedimentorum]
MRSKACDRRHALVEELCNDWDKLNISAKALIITGMLLFISVIFIAFYSNGDDGMRQSVEVVFRSSLSSVFGFLLSSNIKTQKTKTSNPMSREIHEEKCEEEIEIYNYKEGNLIQIAIALVVCVVSITCILVIYITDNSQNIPSISHLRDLMCISIGFLLGESNIKK